MLELKSVKVIHLLITTRQALRVENDYTVSTQNSTSRSTRESNG